MDDKKFLELLKLCGKEKKAEDETVLKIPVEIKTHKKRLGKTFYDRWMEHDDE